MRDILPQLPAADSNYTPTTPLPRRLERVAQVLARDEFTIKQAARACRVSDASIYRLKLQPVFRARLGYLRQQLDAQALEDEPLARKGQRVAVAGRMVRTLHEQLEANGYDAVLGVSKQGNEIRGFDRARVSEVRQYLAYIEGAMEPRSPIVEGTTHVGVSVTIDQAVTRVQALLSRTQPQPADDAQEEAHTHTRTHEGAHARTREG